MAFWEKKDKASKDEKGRGSEAKLAKKAKNAEKSKKADKSTKQVLKSNWRELTDAELKQKHNDMKKEIHDLRFRVVTGSVPNVRKIRSLKRNIARALTQKQLREINAKAVKMNSVIQ